MYSDEVFHKLFSMGNLLKINPRLFLEGKKTKHKQTLILHTMLGKINSITLDHYKINFNKLI